MDWLLYGREGQGVRAAMCAGIPAGGGKTAIAQTVGRLSGLRFAVLTGTRTLEDQVVDDGYDIVNVRGKANYECREFDPAYTSESGIIHEEKHWSCDEGPEHECKYAFTSRCTYGERVEAAKKTQHGSLHNYQYWFNARSRNAGALEGDGGPIQLLICDEAHLAWKELARFLSVWVSSEDLKQWGGDEYLQAMRETRGAEHGRVGVGWLNVLEQTCIRVGIELEKILSDYFSEADAMRRSKRYRKLSKLWGNLERAVGLIGDANWIWKLTKYGIEFNCIWPAKYAPQYLVSGVPRVILMSASLREKGVKLAGFKTGEYYFREWPRVFPEKLGMVYWLPTGRMGKNAGPEAGEAARVMADRIYDEWAPKHKGIVHTNSYARAEQWQAGSRWGRHMIVSKRGAAGEAAERYKKADPPCILVSPSFTTGWDFPDQECRWQHIPKVPFGDRSDPVTLARIESDPDYDNYETMQTFHQACFRGQRHEKDECVTICTDDAIGNFRKYARRHAPEWFRVHEVKEIPRAPKS